MSRIIEYLVHYKTTCKKDGYSVVIRDRRDM